MNKSRPGAVIVDGTLSVTFVDCPVVRSVEVACVVDLTDFGDVVGVEVLDWVRQLSGGALDAPSPSGQFRWSYDAEIDALYVHVTQGRGQIQRSGIAKVGLDCNQCVVRLELQVPLVV